MIPVLYDSENINTTYGKGKLAEIISCVVYEELNGDYSMEFEYPVSGAHYEELISGGTVFCYTGKAAYNTTVTDYQRAAEPCWFDIYKHSLPVDGVVTFYANHISRRLARKVFYMTQPITALQGPAVVVGGEPSGNAYGGVYFNGTNNVSGITDSFTLEIPQSNLSLLIGEENSLTSYFGIDMTINGRFSTINNVPNTPTVLFTFDNKAGLDRGLSIHYGYNLTDINQNKDISGTFNAVFPFWRDGSGNITTVTGFIVQPTTPISPIKAVPLDCTEAFTAKPTEAQLVSFAQNYLDSNLPWIAGEDITVDFINDASNNGRMPAIGLGDTARVYWGDAGVFAELRVVAYKYDVLGETFTEVRLGKKQENFVSITGINAGYGSGQDTDSPLGVQVMPAGAYNLNDFTAFGFYFFPGAATLTNNPSGNPAGWLMVLPAGSVVKQIWYRSSVGGVADTFQRLSDNGTWTSWVRFSTDNDTQDGSSSVTDANGTAARKYLYKTNHIVYFEYQSASRAWSQGDSICTIPSGFRPTVDTFYLNGMNNFKIANIQVAKTSGLVTANQLETVTGNSRIYINGWWYV